MFSRCDDAPDLLGRKYRRAIDRERFGFRLLQFDRDMITCPLGDPIDRIGIRVVHAAVDLETVGLALRIFPGRRAQIGQGHLALAAVQFRNLPEFRCVTLAVAAGEIIENAPARGVDRRGAAPDARATPATARSIDRVSGYRNRRAIGLPLEKAL